MLNGVIRKFHGVWPMDIHLELPPTSRQRCSWPNLGFFPCPCNLRNLRLQGEQSDKHTDKNCIICNQYWREAQPSNRSQLMRTRLLETAFGTLNKIKFRPGWILQNHKHSHARQPACHLESKAEFPEEAKPRKIQIQIGYGYNVLYIHIILRKTYIQKIAKHFSYHLEKRHMLPAGDTCVSARWMQLTY